MIRRLGGADRVLLGLLGAGLLVRLIAIAWSPGIAFDIAALRTTAEQVATATAGTYSVNEFEGLAPRWPYPGGFLPVLATLHWIAEATGLSFDRLVRLPAVAADLALAALLYYELGRRGMSLATRRAAVALIALGPVPLAISSVHGQIDAVAFLPAVAAIVVWERGGANRAVVAGALLGTAGSIKTVPLLLVLAMLPTVRDRREVLTLGAIAAALPLLVTIPFALNATEGLRDVVSYRGIPGRAGLALLVDPHLALFQLAGGSLDPNGLSTAVLDATSVLLGGSLLLVAALLWRARAPATTGAIVLLLTFYVMTPSLLPQYWLWVIPFLLLRGWIRAALVLQLAVLPLLVAIYYTGLSDDRTIADGLVLYGYVPWVALVTTGFVAGAVLALRRGRRTAPAPA